MSIGHLVAKDTKVNSVLGIDASTQSVAFCLYGPTGPERWGEITFKGKNTFERLGDAQRKVGAAFKDFNPDEICFEAATYIQSKQTVILLAYSFGAILGAIMKPGVKVESVPPIAWQTNWGNPAFTKDEKAKFKAEHPNLNDAKLKESMREWRKQRTIDLVEQ